MSDVRCERYLVFIWREKWIALFSCDTDIIKNSFDQDHTILALDSSSRLCETWRRGSDLSNKTSLHSRTNTKHFIQSAIETDFDCYLND
jgi:hypothetical protein